MKKFLIAFIVFAAAAFSYAERYSKRFVAVLDSSGRWSYTKIPESNKEATVWFDNLNYGTRYTHRWTLGKHEKPGFTTKRVEEFEDFAFPKDFIVKDNVKATDCIFMKRFADYGVMGNMVVVNLSNEFAGEGYLVQFLMKDGITEESCIESFLRHQKETMY